MKVILKEDYEQLGKAGEVVNVADGYARNYLMPRGLALRVTRSNMAVYEAEKRQKEILQNKARRTAEALAKELEKVSCTAVVPVGEEDKIFGSVTNQNVADLLKEKGYDIDRRNILLDEPIRALGVYTVGIRLHPEVEGKIKVWVVKE
ncbi:MAG: 50S ribosomal protein L9 [Candidatus Handelsmanbacteria bacterium RIFCSPLOWO2_12_FULL_64_10]|uniref:Large ribosomal subunit protein bL9 n=1 Tax=Handelsmanbacteria sp. (strain RIFCSPLOWO2_12_FULL_64_10) TaxID=1817868 RepID=A0A1F6CRC3_HANXR|nr:MAG: 50S ribosomal protein L9 [Candidatus Handelsmanbacteria bacterium RIFCSPLOWO2_12_FULL_64_10]